MFIGYGLGISPISQICTDYRSDTRVELFCEKSKNISKAKIVLMFLQNGEFDCVEPFHFRKKESLFCENTTEDLEILIFAFSHKNYKLQFAKTLLHNLKLHWNEDKPPFDLIESSL